MTAPAPHAAPAPRIAFTALVALFEAAHLAWEHLHGGIVSHHLLADPNLPAIWNGWGLLLLPALAWLASARLFGSTARPWRPRAPSAYGLAGAALAGIALSVAFGSGNADAAGAVFLAIAVVAIAVRAYRPELLLGFALGMAFTFGGILPLLIGGVLAAASAFAWLALWPVLRRAVSAVRA